MRPARSPYHVFLVLEPLRTQFSEMLLALDPVGEGSSPRIVAADAYYRPDTDVALLSLRVDARSLTGEASAWLRDFASGAGLPLLDPSRLTDEDRRRFYDVYLEGYPIRAQGLTSAQSAALVLGRRLGLVDGDHGASRDIPAPAPVGDDDRPDDLVWPADPELSASGAPQAPPPSLQRRLARAGSDSDANPPPRRPRGKGRQRDRARTIPGTHRAGVTRTPRAAAVPATGGPGLSASAPEVGDAARRAIATRYLRGDDWLPGRLRSVSLKGAYVAAGGAPRVGDTVQVALGFRDLGAVLRGRVVQVTSPQRASEIGSSGFRVEFPDGDDGARGRLAALLRAARTEGVSLTPPPARSAVRFPVKWPAQLSTPAGGAVAAALDISSGGLFLATRAVLSNQPVWFHLPVEDSEPPIVGRARVARVVTRSMARDRGLSPGYGLSILDLSGDGAERYDGFVDRIRRRSEHRVVVAASPERAVELSAALGAVGYAVTASADADGLLRRTANTGQRPPDAVVLDASFGAGAARRGAWVRDLLDERGVSCVETGGEGSVGTRVAVDSALPIW